MPTTTATRAIILGSFVSAVGILPQVAGKFPFREGNRQGAKSAKEAPSLSGLVRMSRTTQPQQLGGVLACLASWRFSGREAAANSGLPLQGAGAQEVVAGGGGGPGARAGDLAGGEEVVARGGHVGGG